VAREPPDGQRPNRETDAFDTIMFCTTNRRAAGLPAERLAAFVCARFRPTAKNARTVRVRKTGITGGRAENPPPNRQEGKNGPDYRKKSHCHRKSICAARMKCARNTLVIGSTACACARGAAQLCPKFGNAIRKDRAVLHRERPKEIGRGIVQLPPLCWGCEAECPSICKFSVAHFHDKDAGIVQ
jgi:hypothetical protein